ncbi:MAG: hypothetical protein J4428_00250 [Candidatus Aenigmarchaeota archaeon]|nr:hypothetical protein [Candidatus Aenigmarchaeota archaeon]
MCKRVSLSQLQEYGYLKYYPGNEGTTVYVGECGHGYYFIHPRTSARCDIREEVYRALVNPRKPRSRTRRTK